MLVQILMQMVDDLHTRLHKCSFFNNAEDFLAVANGKDTHVPHITPVSITEALPGTIYKSLYLCGCFATRSSSSIMIFLCFIK